MADISLTEQKQTFDSCWCHVPKLKVPQLKVPKLYVRKLKVLQELSLNDCGLDSAQ